MAKGLRSKVKRRLRTARREHFHETQGKFDQQKIASRLHNPYYDLRSDFAIKPNAFVEPKNPQAIFPQIAKPNIMDFRSHKMAKGGWTGMYNFRKMHSATAKRSKYESIVKTQEELDREEIERENHQDMEDLPIKLIKRIIASNINILLNEKLLKLGVVCWKILISGFL